MMKESLMTKNHSPNRFFPGLNSAAPLAFLAAGLALTASQANAAGLTYKASPMQTMYPNTTGYAGEITVTNAGKTAVTLGTATGNFPNLITPAGAPISFAGDTDQCDGTVLTKGESCEVQVSATIGNAVTGSTASGQVFIKGASGNTLYTGTISLKVKTGKVYGYVVSQGGSNYVEVVNSTGNQIGFDFGSGAGIGQGAPPASNGCVDVLFPHTSCLAGAFYDTPPGAKTVTLYFGGYPSQTLQLP
jgi:hypothetical protein